MNAQLDPQNESHRLAHVAADEQPEHGWPGDGSGADDLADYNANEADDYRDEDAEDDYLDASYEDRTDIGCDY